MRYCKEGSESEAKSEMLKYKMQQTVTGQSSPALPVALKRGVELPAEVNAARASRVGGIESCRPRRPVTLPHTLLLGEGSCLPCSVH